ncbi:MAG: hypothetical protein DRR15_09560, partial [Gammaproteobacteria bacterium]
MKRFINITAAIRWHYYNAFLHSLGRKQPLKKRSLQASKRPLWGKADIRTSALIGSLPMKFLDYLLRNQVILRWTKPSIHAGAL